MSGPSSWRRRSRPVVALLVAAAVVVPVGVVWARSLVSDTYSVMSMGEVDLGGGAGSAAAHAGHGGGPVVRPGDVLVPDLAGPHDRPADVAVTLVARWETVRLGGREVPGYTLNGSSPGPLIRATQGDVVKVTLVNESVDDGVSLHWHGVDVPNAEDGVAGVTQDAVPVGGRHTYAFVAEDAGTYWYHSHQVSHVQVRNGLFGVLVVDPPAGDAAVEVLAPVHTYDGLRTVAGSPGRVAAPADPGAAVRVRVVNTDDGPLRAEVVGASFRVLAVDGREVSEPGEVTGRSVAVPAGGRADLGFTLPDDGRRVLVQLAPDGAVGVEVGPPDGAVPAAVEPGGDVDLLAYGRAAPLGFDPAAADRVFGYDIGRRPGFRDGVPGLQWSVNGRTFPDLPMLVVREGDVVRVRVHNGSGERHPMHLHGHHVVVLSRDGAEASGSPWVVDSLDVEPDETYEIAFVADNPGVWAFHCHQLQHAADGFVGHLAYEGVSTPYVVGGSAGNEPE